ncbi:MAG: hypothetical protein EXR30_02015 [Betaproteobacteria bacterium]|nr:hypothetical protein [Betaproteobacteria bacterium]MSQ88407.1 hypothetical protein [Betaproteobacteria bacterium]
MQPIKIGRVLASDTSLQPVVEKARQISALSKLCFDFLPPGQAHLVRALSFNTRLGDRQLVLLAASPAAAAKLKLLSEALLRYLLQQGAQVNSVSVRVQPGVGPENVADRPAPRRLSRSALNALQALHQQLPESSARKALKTLLDHHFASMKAGEEKT